MTDGLKPPTNEKCWGFGNRAVELQLLQPLCVDPKELKGKKFKVTKSRENLMLLLIALSSSVLISSPSSSTVYISSASSVGHLHFDTGVEINALFFFFCIYSSASSL